MATEDQYWKKTRSLTISLLVIWILVTFVVNWYAKELNQYVFLGFPLGFYMGAQGTLFIFLAIIGFYNWRMRALETRYGVKED